MVAGHPGLQYRTPMPPQPFWTFLGGGGDTFQGKKNAAKTINAKWKSPLKRNGRGGDAKEGI